MNARASTGALVFAALSVVACSPAGTTPASVSIPRETGVAPAAAPAEETNEALVWTVDDQGKPVTHWVAPRRAGFVERGEAHDLLIAVDADVWRWTEKTEKVATVACDEMHTPPGEGNAVRGAVERLGSTDQALVIAPAQEDGSNEIQQSVSFEGSVGPYLFVRESTSIYSCGAHGMVVASLVAWDLKRRATVDLLSADELAGIDAAERAEAQQKLPPFEAPLKLEDVAFRGPLPRYGDRGALRFDYAFTTFACYACSSGGWDSYSTAVDITARRLPERARPFAKTPGAVAAWASAHAKTPISGWSELSPEAARVVATVIARAD